MTNTIARRNNGNGYTDFGNVVDNIFQSSLRRFFDGNFWEAENQLSTGSVPVNIRETEQQYELDVIAPGCRKEDFSIRVDNNVLTISLVKKQASEQKEKSGWVRNEFVQQAFSRSFTLDETVDTNKINAAYTDGILHLVLGKNEKAQTTSRQIEVK
ncbi:MAG: Hsp20/alpha crystallin family protein [Bacteroidetes bacterium]|nr:Hsp20/alpha crystallin family protein [Bacteroidota bacterium]MBS1608688.1 Hsp20/alpha crystallin family protein [Bacteroidota bacterium]